MKIFFSIKDGSIRTEKQLDQMVRSKVFKIKSSVGYYYECDDATLKQMSRRTKRAYLRKKFKLSMSAPFVVKV